MTTLKKGIIASGLNQVLSSRGPYTLFAPSDTAFNKMDKETLETLLKPENKMELTALMNRHVIAGKVDFKNLKDGDKLKNLDGKELLVNVKDGKVSVDGIMIENRDVSSSNGVIHSLDTVLKN